MIYKFLEGGVHETCAEFYLMDGEDAEMNGHSKILCLQLDNPDGNGGQITNYHHFTKDEVFKLIGALHLLHKEMKDE